MSGEERRQRIHQTYPPSHRGAFVGPFSAFKTFLEEDIAINLPCLWMAWFSIRVSGSDFRRFGGGDKIVQYVVGRWLHYSDVFDYAKRFLKEQLVIFANADIHFDSSLGILQRFVRCVGNGFGIDRGDTCIWGDRSLICVVWGD